jgi:electron transport complex protein RnfD
LNFLRITSPHGHGPLTTTQVMQAVLLATLPGVAALTWFFGPGTLINILFGGLLALALEYSALRLRHRNPKRYLQDYSVLVTSTLLCIALPPYAPWWLVATGILSAVILGKHVFGGLGYNPFNPAMVGYVVLLISFPLQMSSWQAPRGLGEIPGVAESLTALFVPASYDGVTMATPLDILRQNKGLLLSDLYNNSPQFGQWAGVGWEWVIYRGIFTWHAPIAMLFTLGLCAAIGFDSGSSESGGSPLFHWLSGATMFGAFFIITDPVSGATSNRGRLVFGALVGVLLYLIRVAGNYPDAVAFAVLILNFAAPFIDQYTQPVTYGHKPNKRDDE